jgi:hypothetical protein
LQVDKLREQKYIREKKKREKKKREKKKKEDNIRKAKRLIQITVNKAKNNLKARGVLARRAEKERRAQVLKLELQGEFIPIKLLDPIRDPKKDPTPQEQEDLLPPPALVQNLQEAYGDDYPPLLPIDLQVLEEDVVIQLEIRREEVEVIEEESDDSDLRGNVRIIIKYILK